MICLFLLLGASAAVGTYYVDQSATVSGTRDGSWDAPFATISDCVGQEGFGVPGDECLVRDGIYFEDIAISGIRGDPESPVVIGGYKDERPIIDGTVEIKPISGKWEKTGKMYSGKIKDTVWQLWMSKKDTQNRDLQDWTMMTNARWPNTKWSDESVFQGDLWATLTEGSFYDWEAFTGRIVDDTNHTAGLAESGINATGAMSVMNIDRWNTYVTDDITHEPGADNFTFNGDYGKFHLSVKHSRYFFEDKLELLDAKEEWHFDKDTNVLSFIPPTGFDMETAVIRGKVKTYAMSITDAQHMVIRNFDFFGTTLETESKKETNHTSHIKLDSNHFKYPSYSKRMLGDSGRIQPTKLGGEFRSKDNFPKGSFHIFNNTFYGTDGWAVAFYGERSTIENNFFMHNDWTGNNMLKHGGGESTIKGRSDDDTYIRNTLYRNGNGCGIRPSKRSTVAYNRIIGQCFGKQQNDGAAIQFAIPFQPNSNITHNWISDSPKLGIRYDGEPPRTGVNGTVEYNVVWDASGILSKGDYHTIDRNLAFRRPNDKEGGACLSIWHQVRSNPVPINQHNTVTNNIAEVGNGAIKREAQTAGGKTKKVYETTEYYDTPIIKTYPVQGEVVENNLFSSQYQKNFPGTLDDILMDKENEDFRPVRNGLADKQGAGPYEYSTSTYWIPGRQEWRASNPVPPNGSISVIAARRREVAWLNAYGCDRHMVFFGTDKEEVRGAKRGSEEWVGDARRGGNVRKLKVKVEPGVKYYWRVDAVMSREKTVEGDVWSFTAV